MLLVLNYREKKKTERCMMIIILTGKKAVQVQVQMNIIYNNTTISSFKLFLRGYYDFIYIYWIMKIQDLINMI
jgi:hypothetical protein